MDVTLKLLKGITLSFHESLSEMLEIDLPDVILSRTSKQQGPTV